MHEVAPTSGRSWKECRQHTPMFFFFFFFWVDMFEVEKEIVYSEQRADCQHIAGSGLDGVISKRMLNIFFPFFSEGGHFSSQMFLFPALKFSKLPAKILRLIEEILPGHLGHASHPRVAVYYYSNNICQGGILLNG